MMSRVPMDFSLARQGRSLDSWLPDLLAEIAPTRLAAGEALQAMQHALPSVHTELTTVEWATSEAIREHGRRFEQAVRDAVASPGFDTRGFVRRLISFRIALHEDWCRRVGVAHERDSAPNPREERLLGRIRDAKDDEERSRAIDRYSRWSFARTARNLKPQNDPCAGAESLSPAGLMARRVFQVLDVALLTDRAGMHEMLSMRDHRSDVLLALARIGPPAVDFAPGLLDELDAGPSQAHFNAAYFDAAQALSTIGREDPSVIDGLLRRVRSGPMEVRVKAAWTLAHMAPPLAGRAEAAIDLLLNASFTPELVGTAVAALGAIGRDNVEALDRVLEVAAPRPPRMESDPGYPQYSYDAVMHERSAAIDAMPHFQGFADRVVPVLIEAFDTFEEFDSDLTYNGQHERVCHALESFGSRAAPAVPRLIRALDEWQDRPEPQQGEWPKDIFRLLASIGPEARASLPILERFRATLAYDDAPPEDLDPDDPLDQAILALRR